MKFTCPNLPMHYCFEKGLMKTAATGILITRKKLNLYCNPAWVKSDNKQNLQS